MRVGAAQDLMTDGVGLLPIMRAGGWKSTNIIGRYVEHTEIALLGQMRRSIGSGVEPFQPRDRSASQLERQPATCRRGSGPADLAFAVGVGRTLLSRTIADIAP